MESEGGLWGLVLVAWLSCLWHCFQNCDRLSIDGVGILGVVLKITRWGVEASEIWFYHEIHRSMGNTVVLLFVCLCCFAVSFPS